MSPSRSNRLPLRRSLAGVACALALVAGGVAGGAADGAQLFLNHGFETGTWGGQYDFVDSNNATALVPSPQYIPNWGTVGNSVWVEDPTRAAEGARFLWLDPSNGPEVCTTYTMGYGLSGDTATQFVGGEEYTLSLNYAFFDPNDLTGSNPDLSSLEIYAVLGETGFGRDPSTREDIFLTSGSVSRWTAPGGGSGIQWMAADITFTMPALAGYDTISFFISAPSELSGQPTRGVAIDNMRLAAVPEPGTVLLLAACGLVTRLRRALRDRAGEERRV